MSQHQEPSASLDQLASLIIGAAIEVHRVLGPGYLECVYEEAMAVELELRKIPASRQVCMAVDYKGHQVGEGRMDLVVDDLVIVELKTVETLLPLHTAQLLSYLKATHRELGLLINFNVPMLRDGIKRVIRSKPGVLLS